MKHKYTLDISTEGSLKVKRRTIIHTSQSLVHNEQIKEVSSSFHITVEEDTLLDAEATNEEVDEAPPALEDGVQATVDELKEINLGTTKEPRPTFISALLTPEEEERYLKLLVEYKDVFAWTYKEMPGLNPSIALHHLAVKKGVHPVKQAQRRFRPELIPQIETEVNKAPPALEDGIQATVDELKKINLGTIEEPRPTFISALLIPKEEEGYLKLLVEYKDVFAWTYKEMPGLNPSIALHHLAIKKGVRPVKQARRCFRPELIPQIETKVNKLIEAGFIREVQYP